MPEPQPAKPVYCRKCGHGWFFRNKKKPRQCPKCKTTAFDREPKRPRRRHVVADAGFGAGADTPQTAA